MSVFSPGATPGRVLPSQRAPVIEDYSLGDQFKYGADLQTQVHNFNGRRIAELEAYKPIVRELRRRGHDVANPARGAPISAFGDLGEDPTRFEAHYRERLEAERDAVWSAIQRVREDDPKAFADLPATREDFETTWREDLRALDEEAAVAWEHAGFMGSAARIAGSLYGGLQDPINLVTAPIAAGQGGIAKTVATEALLNAGIEAGTRGERAEWADELGVDLPSLAQEMAEGALVGAVLGGAGEGASAIAYRARGGAAGERGRALAREIERGSPRRGLFTYPIDSLPPQVERMQRALNERSWRDIEALVNSHDIDVPPEVRGAINASVRAEWARAEAARVGADFDEVQRVTAVGGERLQTAAPDEIAAMLHEAGRLERGFAPSRGRRPQSLIAFLRQKGGIRDEGTEVMTLLGGSARTRPGLVSNKGMSLDEAAEAVREAGFFPEQMDSRDLMAVGSVTRDMLLEAIDEELRGRPRYALEVQDAANLQERAANLRAEARALEDEVDRLAVDYGDVERASLFEAVARAREHGTNAEVELERMLELEGEAIGAEAEYRAFFRSGEPVDPVPFEYGERPARGEAVTVGGATKRFVNPAPEEYRVVWVDLGRFNDGLAADRAAFVGPGGVGEIEGRLARATDFIRRTDEGIEMPLVGGAQRKLVRDDAGNPVPLADGSGYETRLVPGIVDGRHRLAALTQMGVRRVPVAVHESEAARVAEAFGAGPSTDAWAKAYQVADPQPARFERQADEARAEIGSPPAPEEVQAALDAQADGLADDLAFVDPDTGEGTTMARVREEEEAADSWNALAEACAVRIGGAE